MHHAEDDGIVEVEVLTPMPSSPVDAPHKCITKTIMLSSSVDAARWQWKSSSRLFLLSMFRAWLEQYRQVHQLMQHADGFAADG